MLRHVLYTKSQTLRKKKDNLRYIHIYTQKPDTLRDAIFLGIFEVGGGGRAFLLTKRNVLCVKFLYENTMHFP